jgi:glutaredoxin/glutathione-dependent peroxiredoxin
VAWATNPAEDGIVSISVGDRIPDVTLRVVTDTGADPVASGELLGAGRVVLFAVPGAFTPTCSNVHLPSYVETAGELSSAGVDRIVCLAVNDPFVMAAWGASQGVGSEITLVSDGNAEFTDAIGMGVDASRAGMGTRSKRYAMVIEDGVVTTFLPEEDGFSAIVSTGQCVVDALKA